MLYLSISVTNKSKEAKFFMSPCIDPSGREAEEEVVEETAETVQKTKVVEQKASVGVKAPDFEATALVDGDFEDVKLSDYAGEWVVLCFYPADFTFV